MLDSVRKSLSRFRHGRIRSRAKIPFAFTASKEAFRWSSFASLLGSLAWKLQAWLFQRAARRWLLHQSAEIYYFRESLEAVASPYPEKTVLEVHTWYPGTKRHLRRLKGVRLFLPITKALAEELEGLGISKEKILVAPDGVDLRVFEHLTARDDARVELNLPQKKFLVLYAGNLFRWKGVYTDTLVVFVGGSPSELNQFNEFLRLRGITNVSALGWKPPKEIPKYLAAADVLVLPNSAKEPIGARYTSPLKLFEYMAAGRPIVASDVPAIREILDETTAYLVSPDDPAALAKGILQALADPAGAGKKAEVASRRVQQYSWTERSRRIVNRLNSAVW
ncbi:glycosyltransferase family 4 protein [Candidatus Azambacteria bacterium]|nr:glycosyltransferase family 4 protein [Candidatus Azambacteria bacterium]